jgi:minichromosome maintenance protein 10
MICDWHFTNAVQTTRSSRAEFSSRCEHSFHLLKSKFIFCQSTSGMTSKAKTNDYGRGPRKDEKQGLLPESSSNRGIDGEAVYMYGGSAIRSNSLDEAVGEKIGRGRQERLKRKREMEHAEDVLAKLAKIKPNQDSERTVKKQQAACSDESMSELPSEENIEDKGNYSPNLIKLIGFNPAVGQGRSLNRSSEENRDKVCGCRTVARL